MSQEEVQGAVYGAIVDLNQGLPADCQVPLDGSIDIFAAMDSLAALNFLLRIEQRLGDLAGTPCDLMDSDLYETTLFRSPTLDELVGAIHTSVVRMQ